MSVFFGILAVALLAITGQQPAFGGELRVLDYDNEGSTSQCIGNPVTPLCAVETLEACTKRGEWDYCGLVGFDPNALEGRLPDAYLRLFLFRYEVVARRTLKPADIPPWA